MKKPLPFHRPRLGCLLLLGMIAVSAGPAQFRPDEILQREFWEEFLQTAEIVSAKPIGEGVTAPLKILLRKGEVEKYAAWKAVTGAPMGVLDEWRFEVAAYRLDKLIGLNMVPPCVERSHRGRPGALSLWADNKHSLLEVQEKGIPIPKDAFDDTEKTKYLARLWDSLVGNDDRTQQNVLYTDDWRMILIDHSRAFRSEDIHKRRLMFGRNGLKMRETEDGSKVPMLFRFVPRALVERIRGLTEASVREAAGSYLTENEVEAVIARRGLILDEIAALAEKFGETNVLYAP
ncbi:MAG: hypothetical protein FJY82_09010 [Candidatus Aminicenantes bacterium]|nr:hypothetical protein [Candidatus Aminicenantes bacterium]